LLPACLPQNFENGMGDAQLDRLIGVLKQGRIWAVNVGENFGISQQVRAGSLAPSPHWAWLGCWA
jgi:hypothetical protein